MPAAELSPPSCTPKGFRELEKRVSIQITRLDLGMALRTLPQKTRSLSHSHQRYKVMNLILGSGTAKEREPAKSPCGDGGRKKSASNVETPPTARHLQARIQRLKYGRFVDLVPESRPLPKSSASIHGSLVVSAAFKRNNRLALAFREKDFQHKKQQAGTGFARQGL